MALHKKNIQSAIPFKKETKLKMLLENASDAILVFDQKNEIVFSNKKAAEVSGYTPEELLAKKASDFLEPNEYLKIKKIYNQIRLKDIPKQFETAFLNKKREKISLSIVLTEIKWQGKPAGFCIARDINQQKTVESALQESEEKYQELVENISDIIFHLDNKGNFIYISPVVKQLTGFEPKEVIGHSFLDFLNPEDIASAKESLRAAQKGQTKPYEAKIFKKDGTPMFIRSFGRALMKKKKMIGIMGVITDITERKLAEKALWESEKKYRNVFENAPFGIFHSTLKGKLIRANPALAKMLRFTSPEELIQKVNRQDISRVLYVDKKKRAKILQETLASAGWKKYKNRYFCKDTEIVPTLTLIRRTNNPDQKEFELEGFMEDISEQEQAEKALRESEKKYRQLIENLHDAVYLLNQKGDIEYVSPAIEEITGYKPEEVIGKNILDFSCPEDMASAQNLLQKVFSGEEVKETENKIFAKDGRIRWIKTYNRVLHKGKTPFAIQGVLSDITEKKEAEERMLESYKYLGTVNRQISVISGLNNIFKESNKKKIMDFIILSALEISNSRFAALYKLNPQTETFELLSFASQEKFGKKEKHKLSRIPLKSSEFFMALLKNKFYDTEKCFEKISLGNLSLKRKIDYFCALPLSDREKIKGLLVFGSTEKRELNDYEKIFYKTFTAYVSFILTDIGMLK
jgi:PAS domain S-box-containing protein